MKLTRSLLDCETVFIVIDENGNTAIGSQIGEPWLLLCVLRDVDALIHIILSVGLLELLQEDSNLVT